MTRSAWRRRLLVALAVACLLTVAFVGVTASTPATDGSATGTQQDVITVDDDGDADYETIQAAVNAASDGDTVQVLPGEYQGFRVGKNVTVDADGAVVIGDVEIGDSAAPTLTGFTADNGSIEYAGFSIQAEGTAGDWTVRDVTLSDVSGVRADNSTGDWRVIGLSGTGENGVYARNTSGSWSVTGSSISTIQAEHATGDWTVIRTEIAENVYIPEASGDWTIRNSLIGSSSPGIPLSADNTSGSWRIVGSAILPNDQTAVDVDGTSGDWRIERSYIEGEIASVFYRSTSNPTITDSYLRSSRTDSSNEVIDIWRANGTWTITDTVIDGAIDVSIIPATIDATGNYWGQPDGPRDGQCTNFADDIETELDCGQPRSSPPPDAPNPGIVRELRQGQTLTVAADGSEPYETIAGALADATDGSTIRVRRGEYDGFRVDKDVQIVTDGAAIDGTVRIVGDAAPIIEGFTLRTGEFNARETSGDWVLRDVTAREFDSVRNEINAGDSTGNWRVINSEVHDIQAGRAEGDWTVARSTVRSDLKAIDASGDWTVRDTVIGTVGSQTTVRVAVTDTSGDWRLENSAIVRANATAVGARASTGSWQIVGSYVGATVEAGRSSGDWTVRDSYLQPGTFGSGRESIQASSTGGSWTVTESTVPGQIRAFSARPVGDATGNYWGQPGGPRDGQCEGNVDCDNPLDGSPVTIPPIVSDVVEPPAQRNQPPVPVLNVDRPTQEGRVFVGTGASVTFDASNSRDPDGTIAAYDWSVSGDGSGGGSGETFTRTFEDTGTYEVNLTVSDGADSEFITATVEALDSIDDSPGGDGPLPDNLPPVARLAGPDTTVETGERIELSAAASQDLDSSTLASYQWDTDGDGEVDQRTNNPVTSVSYDEAGAYDVTVTVIDSGGATDQATTTIRAAASEAIPTAALSADPNEDGKFVAGPPITFDASGSNAPEGRIVAYEYDFGGGTTRRVDSDSGRNRINPGRTGGIPAQTSHSYDSPGTYTVTVTVIDSQDRRAQASTDVTVESSDSVQVGGVSSSIPGPMVAGVGIENEYSVTVTGQEPIEEVVFAFPNGETREAYQPDSFAPPDTWFVSSVPIDEATTPGTNVVEVRATDESGRTGVGTFAIDVFDPPGWFDFAMGTDPTVAVNDDGKWSIQSDAPTIPSGGLIGPTFQFDLPISQIAGEYDIGVGANYGFEYVFAEREATARGGGQLSFSTPTEGLDLETDLGQDFGGERSRSFSLTVEGTARVTENGQRIQFQRGRVAFGTEASATIPLGGLAVYIPAADATVGVASVDLTLTNGFEPAATLTVNDARTALVPSSFELTETIDIEVTAGAGSSVDVGVGRVGAEARGIAGSTAEFTTEVYPSISVDSVTVSLRAGVRGCLGPCATEWLLDDEYELVAEDNST